MREIQFRTYLLKPAEQGHFYSPSVVIAHKQLRVEVARFINNEVDEGEVVSISEIRLGETGMAITVWYNAEIEPD